MNKRSGILFSFHLLPLLSLADNAAETLKDQDYLERLMQYMIIFAGFVVVFVAMIGLFRMIRVLMNLQLLRIYEEQGVTPLVETSPQSEKVNWWQWVMAKLTKRVPMEQEKDILFDHSYDGIRELDNSLPPWWLAMFYISIVFSVVYFGYYHIWDRGDGQIASYEAEMKEAEEEKAAIVSQQADQVNENNVTALSDVTELDVGKTIYITYCVACHGMFGEGGVGPNLTDDYWLKGGSIQDVFKTIKYGVPEKGMISWSAQLPPIDIHRVASYILTLKGTNPPNPKEPQGELYQADSPETKDSTNNQEIGLNQKE